MLPLEGTLVSRNKGEYAGRCPFKGIGDDRFHWWAGAKNWWCRQECPDCPGKSCSTGGMQGWFDSDEARDFVAPPPKARPSMALVSKYRDNLNGEVLAYLATRGIRQDTARRYWVGRNCRRLTIPCIVRNGGRRVYGIKKRWIGRPPEEWIDTYTMEPGSKGAAIFNFDRLLSKRKWPFFLIIEGVLDCILLDQMGIQAVAPFGGGGVWSPDWTSAFARVGDIILVADNDPDEEGL
ncbi:MAG: hypothetical protein GWN58_25755, partial [Anaerolineae bacterium]|nr:hypothetical protein [Anaerolineae bacterium]